MHSRSVTTSAPATAQHVALRQILQIKERRERRLRRQLVRLRRQEKQLLDEQQNYLCEKQAICAQLNQLLTWSGIATARRLQQQKQVMGQLIEKKLKITHQQNALRNQLNDLRHQYESVSKSLTSLLRKKEKLRMVLGNGRANY